MIQCSTVVPTRSDSTEYVLVKVAAQASLNSLLRSQVGDANMVRTIWVQTASNVLLTVFLVTRHLALQSVTMKLLVELAE